MHAAREELQALESWTAAAEELLAHLGSADPSGARFQELLRECARHAGGLEQRVAGLRSAPAPERAAAEALLRRLAALNALTRAAVRSEQQAIGELLGKARAVRESLGHVAQPGSTGGSCDMRG